MATLTTSLDSIELVTSAAISTDYSALYIDTGAVLNLAAQANDGNVATATTTTLVPAPGPRVVRRVLEITVRNAHASSTQTATLQKNVNGTAVKITPDITLLAGESLTYDTVRGLVVFDSSGRPKQSTANSPRAPQLMSNPAFQANDITSTRALGSGWYAASYMGKAPRAFDWATLRLRVTTAVSAGASEQCQVAIATGDINVGGAPTLTVRGFTSAEGTLNSTGLKSVVVSVAGINEGDNIWAIAGCSAPTVLQVRAGLADDLQGGSFALVSSHPSAILNTPTAFTILGATVSTPWFELVV